MNNYDLGEFAKAAMQGLLSNPKIVTGDKNTISISGLAGSAVNYALATIKALEDDWHSGKPSLETEVAPYNLEDAKRFWNNGRKLFAVKIVKVRKNCLLSQAKKYCEDYF